MKGKSAAVIGSGIAGLAAAIRLAVKGFEVTVFEAASEPGGKMGEKTILGYRFDTGPSVFTMPHLIDELFELCGKNPRDYFNYTKLNSVFNYFYEDGTIINAPHGPEKFAEEIALKTTEKKETVLDFLSACETKYNLTHKVFLERSLHKPLNYLNYETLHGILNFGKIQAFKTMNDANHAQFKDPRVVQLFNRYASYNGSNPFRAPATLNVISHIEINQGAYHPVGGMYAVITALFKLATEQGVKFLFQTEVTGIIISNGKANGVRTDETAYPFDVVVSNMDVFNTYRHLIPEAKKPKLVLRQSKSSSVIVFYWGIQKTFPQLGIHNIFFSRSDKEEFHYIFEKHRIFADPTVYLHISSKANAGDAPEGCENWFVMVSVPNNSGQNWDRFVRFTRKNVLAKLQTALQTDIEPLIGCEALLDPRRVESETSSAFGAVFGNASNSPFSAFLRHPNFSSKIKNLYFCGGSVHPGPGIPLCLLSAKIATDLVK
jgi:phytoene desaturase